MAITYWSQIWQTYSRNTHDRVINCHNVYPCLCICIYVSISTATTWTQDLDCCINYNGDHKRGKVVHILFSDLYRKDSTAPATANSTCNLTPAPLPASQTIHIPDFTSILHLMSTQMQVRKHSRMWTKWSVCDSNPNRLIIRPTLIHLRGSDVLRWIIRYTNILKPHSLVIVSFKVYLLLVIGCNPRELYNCAHKSIIEKAQYPCTAGDWSVSDSVPVNARCQTRQTLTVYSKRNAHLIQIFFMAPLGKGAKNSHGRLCKWEFYTCSFFSLKNLDSFWRYFKACGGMSQNKNCSSEVHSSPKGSQL